MLNQEGGEYVPEKTIALFLRTTDGSITAERLPSIISKPDKKRDWFSSNFYRCLPLTVGNQYGFIVTNEFGFAVEWDGSNDSHALKVFVDRPENELGTLFPRIQSHFGHGVLTINPPFVLRTPPGVNLMTINPPNVILPNITVMTGVVETDNLRRNFTFNLKVQIPNLRVEFPIGTPLAAFIPIPRYYGDSFNLRLASEMFTPELVEEELQAAIDADKKRMEIEPTFKNGVGRDYYQGRDVYGNPFPDHQKP